MLSQQEKIYTLRMQREVAYSHKKKCQEAADLLKTGIPIVKAAEILGISNSNVSRRAIKAGYSRAAEIRKKRTALIKELYKELETTPSLRHICKRRGLNYFSLMTSRGAFKMRVWNSPEYQKGRFICRCCGTDTRLDPADKTKTKVRICSTCKSKEIYHIQKVRIACGSPKYNIHGKRLRRFYRVGIRMPWRAR
jgi:DNA replicative helicase MCM subunit Mcm2 (Cdc46/Mcm family)